MPAQHLAGALLGACLAPITGFVSWLRRSRTFHPRGVLFRAQCDVVARDGAELSLAQRLSGPALVRFSSAWWKALELPDVLGCAIRFTSEPLGVAASDGDQDLLFATIRRPWTLPFAPLATRFRSFEANDYYAVSPFDVAGLGRVEWRLNPSGRTRTIERNESRNERLLRALSEGTAEFTLEVAPYRAPFRIRDTSSFRPLVRLHLEAALDLDQEALRFDPFLNDRGVVPVGFVHALRRATYAASQRARPRARNGG